MSLADCLNKFGKSLDDNDVAIIQQRVTEGMSEVEAVESLIGEIDGEISQIVADVQAAGGNVAMSSPALDRARQEGYQGEDSREASEWSKAVAKGLDMSTEARMKRAREMGFDTDNVYYVSSTVDITEFAPHGKFAGNTGVSGISVTDNPEMASRYLDRFGNFGWVDGKPNQPFSKNVMAVYIKPGNMLDVEKSPYKSPVQMGFPLPEGYENPMIADGYDSMRVPDSISRRGGVKHSDAKNAIRGHEIVLTDPSQIRSVNAAFDPDQAESADLLAQSAAADLSQVDQTETTIGTKFKTGEPVTFWYAHNPDSATKMMGKPKKGDQFGRDFEPSAKFVTPLDREPVDKSDGFEYGQITFNNPLVIENNGLKWKEQLSKAFGGKTGKRLSQAVIDAGFDGIVTVDEIRAGKYATETIDLTSFDPAIALYQSGQQRDLFVAHNLSADNILAAADLGGLAAPSIAVARAGVSDFEGFGEVTLLADPSLLKSKGVRTFDADVYSPRQPRAEYDINERGYAGLRDMVGASVGDLPLSLPDMQSLSQDGADSLVRSEAAQYHWLNEQGKAPKLKNAKVDPEVRRAAKLGVQQYEAADTPAFVKIAEAYYKRSLEAAREASPDRADRFESFWFDENGNVLRDKVRDFAIRVDEFNRTGGKDFGQLRKDIAKKMRVKANSGAYEKWVADQFNGMVDGKQLFKGFTNAGNRKYVPYNMQNVVKEMTQQLQAGEGFFYGAGSARSAYANEMKSIADIQARREQIVPESDMEAIKEESQQVFQDALEKLKPFYKFDADGWGYTDDAGSAIAEGPKGIREAFELNDESKKIIDDLTEYLRALPTSYFEAKAQRPVAFSEFSTAIVPRGMNKDALQVLKDAGLKIKTYNPKEEGARQALIEKQRDVLFQQDEQQFRGELVMAASERFMRLGQASDLSTFIHESGHLFLEMEKAFALEFGVTPDQQALLDFLGLESFDELKVSTDKGREAHEKFAETFEVYAREGKAPSLALRDAFEAFSRWIVRVYKNMLGQDLLKRADLNEEIRGVLDRMLATQEEIDAAMANPAYDQFFRSAEQAGMTDEQYAKYLAKVDKARNRASGDLYEKIVKQLRQRATREWKEERAQIAAVEEERLKREPIYQIIDDLAENKLDHDAVVEILGGKPSGRLIGKTQKGGVDPQEFAEIYGYRNVRIMLDDIVAADGIKKAASDAAEQKMIAKYGDILNDGSIENEAREAAHNTARADVLYEELKAINRGKPQIDRNILKANAKTLIGGLKYREIQPNKYYRAEIRAAQRAVTETDPGAQLEAKMQQLANHYLYKEALRVRERMDKQRKEVKRIKDRANAGKYDTRKVNPAYVQNMATLANLYDLRNKPQQDAAVNSVLNWYTSQIESPDMYVNLNMLDPNLMNALVMRMNGQDTGYNMPTFDDMTASDLEGLVEMLRHLRYVGGKMSEEGLNAFSATREKMAQAIDEKGGKDIVRRMGEKGRHDDAKKWTSEFIHRNASLRNLARVLDDGESGYAYSEIFRTIEDAADRKTEIQADLYRKFKEEMDGHHTLGITKAGHTDVTLTRDNGQPWTLSAAGRFMLAMNWGTESNRQAVMDGFDVTERDVLAMLSQMTPEQLQLVNATWRVNESLWPELSKASVDMMGVSPEKLPPTPFMVNGVKMTGGHMRLFYNGVSTEMREDIAAGEQMARVSPTRAGSTYARVGSGGKEVSLEISNLRRAWDDSAHWIAFAKPAQHVAGLVNSSAVRDAIVRKHGEGFYHAMIKTITGITNNSGPQEQLKLLANISRVARSALTARYLMYSVRNIAQQPSSIPFAMREVGAGQFFEAAMRTALNPGARATVLEKSAKMRERASLVNREAAEYLKTVEISGRAGNAWAAFKRYGFTPQTMIDAAVSYPTWLAKYESAIADGAAEADAVSAADTAVAESIGSGSDLHLGGIYQSTNAEWVKTVTMMGSWMGMVFNRVYRSSKGLSEFNRDVAMEAIVMPMIIAVISAALVMDWPEDEDPFAWLFKTYGKFLGGTVPILRDIVSMMSGFTPTSPVASASAGAMSIPGEILDYVEGDQSFIKTASDVVGKGVASFVPIPGIGNMTRFVDYWESYEQGGEGETFNPYQALTEGPNRND